jgi:hypothetical protein
MFDAMEGERKFRLTTIARAKASAKKARAARKVKEANQAALPSGPCDYDRRRFPIALIALCVDLSHLTK